jgi:hypothetical protein
MQLNQTYKRSLVAYVFSFDGRSVSVAALSQRADHCRAGD